MPLKLFSLQSTSKVPPVKEVHSTTSRTAEAENLGDSSKASRGGVVDSDSESDENPEDLLSVGLVETESRSSVFFAGTRYEEKVRCPKHEAWSRKKGSKNKYRYHYYGGEGPKIKAFDTEQASKLPAEAAGMRFTADHVFGPHQLADLMKNAEIGGRRLGDAPEATARALQEAALEVLPPASPGRRGRHHRALDCLCAALPSGDHHEQPQLVYLQTEIARTKAVYLSRRAPRALSSRAAAATDDDDEKSASPAALLALLRRTLLVARYLRTPRVRDLYREAARRVRGVWVAVGGALARKKKRTGSSASAADAAARKEEGEWGAAFDRWEAEYLDRVARTMNACLARGVRRLAEAAPPAAKTAREWLGGEPVDLSHLKGRAGLKEEKPTVVVDWRVQLRVVLFEGQAVGEERKKLKKKKSGTGKESKEKIAPKGKAAPEGKASTDTKTATPKKSATLKKASPDIKVSASVQVSATKKAPPEAKKSTRDKASTGKKVSTEVKTSSRIKVSLVGSASASEVSTGKKASTEKKPSAAGDAKKKAEKKKKRSSDKLAG